MIHAYDKLYLEKARVVLGRMLDVAVHSFGFELRSFYSLFLGTHYSEDFCRGDFRVLVGMSGTELAYRVLEETVDQVHFQSGDIEYTVDRSAEYWTGWALAYYQWYSNRSFKEIESLLSIEKIRDMYNPFHEMDIRQFCDRLEEEIREKQPQTRLQKLRTDLGLSQKRLSDISNVPVRTIQQYEQRKKKINHAHAETVYALASALCCDMHMLLETEMS